VPVPKIELHVHLEATVRPATLLAIARRNGEKLPADTVEGLTELYEFTDFKHFIDVWVLTTNCLRTADDFRQVVVDYAAEAASFGAIYIEGIFSPPERRPKPSSATVSPSVSRRICGADAQSTWPKSAPARWCASAIGALSGSGSEDTSRVIR